MRQWKSISNNDYIIEEQKRSDIIRRIHQLAASYVPEWQFDEKNPDIGSVIALLFADGMEENFRRYNTLLERDYVELMNMLGISLKPAFPSHSTVVINLSQDTIPGFKLKKGVKLLGAATEEENLVFETAHSMYVTDSRLKSAFMTSGQNGKVVPLLGDFEPVEYVEKSNRIVEEDEEMTDLEPVLAQEAQNPSAVSAFPFTLFDFRKKGYGKYGLLFYHPHLFDVQNNDILMKIDGHPQLLRDIADGKYRLTYYGTSGFEPVQNIRLTGENCISFSKTGKCRKIREKGEEFSLLLLEPVEIPQKNIMVSDIGFSSSGEERVPEFVWNGTSELEHHRFLPFGETMGLYDELYIGHEEYFSKPGAKITLRFNLSFDKHTVTIPRLQEQAELKVIKKKPKKDILGAPAEVFADEVSIEYYNGIGWRKFNTELPIKQLFNSSTVGECEISFVCPKDWAPMEVGGFSGRSIRIQITRSDNCYYQPAIHHYPVISDMQISYTYQKHFEKPAKIFSFQGSKKKDLTAVMAENSKTPIFTISRYQDTSLYLGFDKKMEEGPVSILIRAKETEGYQEGKLTFSYSTREGFTRLKLSDHTDALSHTGTIMFMPPADMAKKNLEGQEAYWIKITDEKSQIEVSPLQRPIITDIQVNAVEVDNVDTMAEESYYIDTFGPNMEFTLNAQNILSLELWVNETGLFSENEMRRMLAEEPGEVKAEYTFLGEIEEFYVKWKEVDNFDRSMPGDRHYVVDRMNSRLLFGDGVHVQVPRNTKGVAFKVIMCRCNGEIANVGIGQIGESLGGMMFVEQLYNPIQAYGGMNMETVEEALCRGTTVLNSRNRLVSVQDYERAALNFSHQIAQAKVIGNRKKDGTFSPGAITMVLLMQDYKDGEHSFIQMRQRLREHLLEKCELSIDESELEIVEPIFVEISVEAWMRGVRTDDTFEVQQYLYRVLEEYLDPLRNNGWDIGRMVKLPQIELRLNMEKGKVLLRRLLVTARYQDENGRHEADLEKLAGNPYVLVTSGNHKIHFEQSN